MDRQGHEQGRLAWRELARERLEACGIFELYRSRRRAQDGREGDFYVLGTPDWVNVVPVLAGGASLLMVRQYRHGLEELTVEFPAGLIEPGETPQEAARRELAEETGYAAGSLVPIGTIAPNPAFMSNRCYTFLAEDLQADGPQSLDALEMLEVVQVPLAELQERIGEPPYVNSLTALALFWYLRTERRRPDSNR